MIRWNTKADHIHLGPGFAHHTVEPLTQQGARTVQTWSVDQNELGVTAMDDAADRMTSGLRLTRGDSHLLANERIRQCGLTRIGSSNKAREAGSIVRWLSSEIRALVAHRIDCVLLEALGLRRVETMP